MKNTEGASHKKRILVFPSSRFLWSGFGNGRVTGKIITGDTAHVLKGDLEVKTSTQLDDWLAGDRASSGEWDLIVVMGSSAEPERLRALGTCLGWVAEKTTRLGAKFGVVMITGDQLHSLQREIINLARNAGACVTPLERVEDPEIVSTLLRDWAAFLDWVQESRAVRPEERPPLPVKKETVRISLPPKPSNVPQIKLPSLPPAPSSEAMGQSGMPKKETVRISLPPKPGSHQSWWRR